MKMSYTQQVIDLATAILSDYRYGADGYGEVHMATFLPSSEFRASVIEFLDAFMEIVRENNGVLTPEFIRNDLAYELDERTGIALCSGCEDALTDLWLAF